MGSRLNLDPAMTMSEAVHRVALAEMDAAHARAKLFAERSGPFVERIEAYWLAAARCTEQPGVATCGDNVISLAR